MNEHELMAKIQDLQKEAARWKQRALNAADKACYNCEEYRPNAKQPCDCVMCPVYKIKEEAGK